MKHIVANNTLEAVMKYSFRLIKDIVQDISKIDPLFEFRSIVFNILEISRFISFSYIDLKVIRIIEVHNFRTNKRISLIQDLIQDISNVGPLSKFRLVRFSISEVRIFAIFPL